MTEPRAPLSAAPEAPSSAASDAANLGWPGLRRLTTARIGLERTGASVATRPLLEFRLAHAQARDAVHAALGGGPGLDALGLPVLQAATLAESRHAYLMRPDLGRRLHPEAVAALAMYATPQDGQHTLAVVVADGLSAAAAERHATPLLARLLPALRAEGWPLAPLVVLRQARVAAGDAVAVALGASVVLMLIGERPGLTAPDSLGAYATWAPHPATTDADRNCVSNIRPAGLGYDDAAFRLAFLLGAMRAGGASGVSLKDESDATVRLGSTGTSAEGGDNPPTLAVGPQGLA